MVFLPIRDSYGTTQLIIILRRNNLPNDKLVLLEKVSNLSIESVITVQGTIIEQPKETINRVNKSVKIKFQATTTIVTDRHEIENHSFQYCPIKNSHMEKTYKMYGNLCLVVAQNNASFHTFFRM